MPKGNCSINGCEQPTYCRGWCGRHYDAWRKYGSPDAPVRVRDGSRTCTVEGCERMHWCKGWCTMHYNRMRRTGSLEPQFRDGGRGCLVEDCPKPHYGHGYCQMHHFRFWRFGDAGEKDMRRMPNGTGYINAGGYRVVSAPGHPNANAQGKISEHVLVMTEVLNRPLKKGENVHHKNGNRTDNAPENLELWNRAQPPGQRVRDRLMWAAENYPDELRALLNGEHINL